MRKHSDRDNHFRFPGNRVLDIELGRFNAMVQLQEVAMLDFLSGYEKNKTESTLNQYVHAKAYQFNIPLNCMPFSAFQSKIHQSYLIYPNACLDNYLLHFVRELKIFINQFSQDEGKDSRLEKIIGGLKSAYPRYEFPQSYIDVYNYFRLARNQIAHRSIDSQKVVEAFNKIDKKEILKYLPQWQNAFKEPNVFELDDLVAFSAISKRISDLMPQRLYPLIDWTKANLEEDEEWKEQIRKTRAKPDKKNTIQGYVVQRYGEPIPDDQIDKVLDNIHLL